MSDERGQLLQSNHKSHYQSIANGGTTVYKNGHVGFHNDISQTQKPWFINTGNLSFHNLNYTVQVSTGLCRKEEKIILKDISGVFSPGMNAIMGPTGGGKTTLLDILAGRKDKTGLSGTVLINGTPQPEDFRLISGYVVQDDVVMGTLTVRENLIFSATLRLPSTISNKEKEERVEDVIQELGLQECADSRVGGEFIRGISGGERKRTNVGMELIIKPSILFMDEPTTGLDASTAGSVMSTMAQLSRRGHTIVFSIHQPRYGIFRLFDKLHLLSRGQTVYHGPANETLHYFSDLGYVCEEHNNLADFILDVVIEHQNNSMSLESANEASEDIERGHLLHSGSNRRNTTLVDHFKQTKYFHDMSLETQEIFEAYEAKDDTYVTTVGYPTSFFTQVYYCSKRAFLNYLRNPKSSYGQTLLCVAMALIIGGIFFQLDPSPATGIQDRVGAFFLVVMMAQVMNHGAAQLFMEERLVFIHESTSGFYRVSSYFISKLFADLLPQRTIPTLLFAVISYYMMGLRPGAEYFFIYTLNLVLVTYASCAIFFFIGASVSTLANAEIFITFSFIFQFLFAGFLINIQSLPSFIAWMEYLSLARYSFKVVSINELKDAEFCYPYPDNATCLSGNAYLDLQAMDYTSWGLWQNFMAMAIMCVGIFILAYIKLRTIPKFK